VTGDLDWIVLRALEKDPNRRYETVNAFAADVRRHLNGEPVDARPPSTVYRLSKFAGRHRASLSAAAAFMLLLAAAAVFGTVQAMRARRAEAVSTAVSNFMQDDVLAQASVRSQSHGGAPPDPDLKVRTALDRAAARVAGRFDSQPEVEASIRTTIGKSYLDLGLDGPAQQQLERARDLYRGLGGNPGAAALDTWTSLERVYARQGNTIGLRRSPASY